MFFEKYAIIKVKDRFGREIFKIDLSQYEIDELGAESGKPVYILQPV